ncbi:ABC transporter ATP-binding protein [Melissococcus plutonius]|uniref:Lipid A export ATP-binding/ permease protein MsbA n=1 Tax=Melissococcus plutonius (strain ATCC 35311 / DSM 29964 / CIP 104052 / LMG 20360 / NCIMB 702443) TaxID=940190 RepID=F3Y9L1_MELPT|nr:ABC transporter ATP-binding protein [Melissococcus plutonius]KMT32930.1 putative multidrug resistance ABC transporter ATP-binding/permease protein YheI [Melissococcus plutonius]KMT34589.1 putative multidrug resistance ABC transporter ATP-binding/permease protein YheI [Melissococcus plutonius]MBB5177039.1 ATP-binding cassette subfamily B protein [Melissococcus plutonius]BAK21189.1 lipid A export ATP-binding/ permease protein MsbA [Melissococcus plutonius ATCC 35311]BBD15009.1 lipid A export 
MFGLLIYAKKYRKQIILGPIFKFLEVCFELVLPLFMSRLVDQGIVHNDRAYIFQTAGWMLGMSVIGLSCVLVCQYFASIASQGFGTELRYQLMKKINQLSYSELNSFGTDTLITRITNDVNQLQNALAMLIRLVIRAPFLSIGSVIMAFYINFQMGLIFLVMLPIFCILLFFIIKTTVPLYKKVQGKLDRLNLQIQQNLSGVRVIRAFAQKKTEQQQVDHISNDLSKVYTRVANISALLTPITTLILNLGILLLLYMGGIKVNTGSLKQGEVLALINYMNQMLLALIVVSNLVIIFTRASASASRVNEVLDVIPTQTIDKKLPIHSIEAIQFDHVSFRYEKEAGLTLDDISLTIFKGTVLGITGPTGSGKSTLTQLIPRFYDVSDGNLFVGGKNVRDWSIDSLRSKIRLVPQTAVLFTGTIRENLQWGKSDASDEECWQALEIAQCKDFVAQLSHGLDTPIYEGGKNFSGGQRQRLTIARALVGKPDLLILDDSLSALDYQTDLALRTALKRELKHITIILISQRIRSLSQAQQILVLNNGKQVGLGTHEELMRNSKEYQEIVASQEEGKN